MGYEMRKLGGLLRRIFRGSQDTPSALEALPDVQFVAGRGAKLSIETGAATICGTVEDTSKPNLFIVNDGYIALHQFTEEALKDDELRGQVGAKALRSAVARFVQDHYPAVPERDFSQLIEPQILQPLRQEMRCWTCLLPVVNLLVKKSLAVGPVLFMSRETGQAEATRMIEGRISGESSNCHEVKQRLFSSGIESPSFVRDAYVRVEVVAHKDYVDTVASTMAISTMNVLRAFTHFFYSPSKRAHFGLPTEVVKGNWRAFMMDHSEVGVVRMSHSIHGAKIPFELDENKISWLNEQMQFPDAVSIASHKQSELKSLDLAILESIQMLGQSFTASSVPLAHVGCCTAIERLLFPRQERASTRVFADRLAFLIGCDRNQRLAIRGAARQLYRTRSNVVHEGLNDVPDEDWANVSRAACHAIVAALGLREQFTEHPDFVEHVENLKY